MNWPENSSEESTILSQEEIVQEIIRLQSQLTIKNIVNVLDWNNIISEEPVYKKLSMKDDKWNIKYAYCESWNEHILTVENFLFDEIGEIELIDWKSIYKAKIWDKEWYLEVWKEDLYQTKVIFSSVFDLTKVDGKFFYNSSIPVNYDDPNWMNNSCFMELWKEEFIKDKELFSFVTAGLQKESGIISFNNKKYYFVAKKSRIEWKLCEKEWYVELWNEKKYENTVIFNDTGEVNKRGLFWASMSTDDWRKQWYICIGEEDKATEKVKFDCVHELMTLNHNDQEYYFYKAIENNHIWYMNCWDESQSEERVIFKHVRRITSTFDDKVGVKFIYMAEELWYMRRKQAYIVYGDESEKPNFVYNGKSPYKLLTQDLEQEDQWRRNNVKLEQKNTELLQEHQWLTERTINERNINNNLVKRNNVLTEINNRLIAKKNKLIEINELFDNPVLLSQLAIIKSYALSIAEQPIKEKKQER